MLSLSRFVLKLLKLLISAKHCGITITIPLVLGRLRQEDSKFKANLGNTARLYSKKRIISPVRYESFIGSIFQVPF